MRTICKPYLPRPCDCMTVDCWLNMLFDALALSLILSNISRLVRGEGTYFSSYQFLGLSDYQPREHLSKWTPFPTFECNLPKMWPSGRTLLAYALAASSSLENVAF